jgi:hypothetical protein
MRAMMLFFAVLFAALAFGSWVVLSPQAALLLAWPALALAVLSIPFDWQIILRPLFSLVYRRWLWDYGTEEPLRVELVKGWRTARVVNKFGGRRSTITACFWGLE